MKTRFLAIAMLMLLVGASDSYALLRVGLKAGVNLANVDAANSDKKYSVKPGFSAGVMAEVPMSPGGLMAARAELLYVQKGAKSETTENNQTVNGTLKIEELVFAPFLVFYLPAPKIKPFLEGGPELGLNTLAKSKDDSLTKNIGYQWKKNNFSLNLGAGILIPAGGGDWILDARYNLGLSDLTLGGGDIKTKTNGIQVFLGYNFFKL
jgi:hypothetical protein